MTEAKLTDAEQLTDDARRRIRDIFEAVPFAQLLGLELGLIERGAVTLHLELRDELLRNRGIAHGGVAASIADTAAALAVNTLLEPDQTTATVDLTIHYLRPLIKGRIAAQAQVLRDGRSLVIINVNVLDEAGAVAATVVTTYLKSTKRT